MNQIRFFKKMPFSLGIETLGGNLYKLVEKRTNLPIKVSTKVKTVMDNQPRIHLKFFLGDRPVANLNKFVAELSLKILKPEKRGQELDLEMRISRAGEVNITLSHRITNKSTSILI
jgi:molecular chaperone DnaK (HSP70)